MVDKGARVRIVKGRQGQGVTGTVFWIGENKWGDGKRLGVRGDDGETYWTNDDNVEPADVPEPVAVEGPEPQRGDRVRWKQRGDSGTGDVFWVGTSKHGPGVRVGVNCDDGETRWLDQRQVEILTGDEAASDAPAQGPAPAAPLAEDEGWSGEAPAWDGGAPPDRGDEPPPLDPPAGWTDEDDDIPW